jgi:hypothetical protein
VLKNLIFLEILIAIGTAIFYMASTRRIRKEIGYLPGIVFGLLAAIAFLSPKLVIVHVAVALVPLILCRTKLQAGLVTAIGLFALPALPTQIVVGGAFLFPWTIQSTLGVSGLIAMLIAPGKMAKAPPWADVAMFIVIAVLVIIDARGGPAVGYLRQFANYVLVYVIPVYVITRSARNAEDWRTMLTAMAAVGVILSVVVLFEARGTWPLYAPLTSHFSFDLNGIIVKWRGGMMRAYGPMGEATNMGFVSVICFAAALAVRQAFRSNLHYVAIVGLIALGSLPPQSRGGLIGMALAFVISSFYRRGVNGLGQVVGAGSLIGGAYALSMVVGSFGDQIQTSLNEAKGTGDYRSELWRRGMEEFWKNPLFGDTFPNVVSRMQDMVQGEGIVDFVNSYLYFMLFAGGIGAALFCLAFIIPMGRLAMIRRRLPPLSAEREVAGFCAALLGSSAVMLAFTSYLQRPSIFLLIASSITMMIFVPRRATKPKAVEPVRQPDGPLTA